MPSFLENHSALTLWLKGHPRAEHALGFDETNYVGDLKDRLAESLGSAQEITPDLTYELDRYMDAVSHHIGHKDKGTFVEPYKWGIRRDVPAQIVGIRRVPGRVVRFRVDFQTSQGWSGYTITRSPNLLNCAKRNSHRDGTLVGTIEKRQTRFFVEFRDDVLVHF